MSIFVFLLRATKMFGRVAVGLHPLGREEVLGASGVVQKAPDLSETLKPPTLHGLP